MVLAGSGHAQDQARGPLSAIDWLSASVAVPVPVTTPERLIEPTISDGALSPDVTTTVLSNAGLGAVGALSPTVSGLPVDLWNGSDPARIIDKLANLDAPALPALQDLLTRLLLTRAAAPDSNDKALLIARLDALLTLGLLPQAQALLDATDPTQDPALFRRWFDVSLLTGEEDKACDAMQRSPVLAPTVQARIFCLARAGNWPAAALTLNTHRALGDLSDSEEALLTRFLDPELFEGAGPSQPPDRITPLAFRMLEAVGEGLSTTRLPLAFATADLSDRVGWKVRLDAAERLALHGALPAPELAQVYLSRSPSASGGVWDRVEAAQAFHAATRIKDTDAISATLPDAWAAMQQIRSEYLFAQLYADDLSDLTLDGAAHDIAVIISNLDGKTPDGTLPSIQALLGGDPTTITPDTSLSEAIVAGFTDEPTTLDSSVGETVLDALALFDPAIAGDTPSVTEAILLLRAAGQDAFARQTATQLLLLDRTG